MLKQLASAVPHNTKAQINRSYIQQKGCISFKLDCFTAHCCTVLSVSNVTDSFYNAASASWEWSREFGTDLCAETRHLIQSVKMKESSEDSGYSQVYPVVSVSWPCDIGIQCSDGGSPVWGGRPRSWQREVLWLLQTSLQQNGKQDNNLGGSNCILGLVRETWDIVSRAFRVWHCSVTRK